MRIPSGYLKTSTLLTLILIFFNRFMKDNIKPFDSGDQESIFTPLFYRLNNPSEKEVFNSLLSGGEAVFVHDEIYGQLQELIKIGRPDVKIRPEEYESLISDHLGGQDIKEYGVWVYYPWSKRLVHLLDEKEFVEVRTNRNQYEFC